MGYTEDTLGEAERKEEQWRQRVDESYKKKLGFTPPQYSTESGIPLKYMYTPADVPGAGVEVPGEYPYTRGIRELGYQYAPWMIQMLHGYGTSEETKKRTEFLIKEGMRGYEEQQAVALLQVDPPTTCGYDPDDPRARGTVGLTGVSISTMEDLDILLGQYDLKRTRVALNTRFSCLPMLAMYLVYAEGKGYKPADLNGQSQNDAPTRWITTDIGGPMPAAQRKLRVELIKYATLNIPRWNHTNLCGYLYGELGATPAQELGIVLSQAVELVADCAGARLKPDDVVPRFSSQVHVGMDFFEEIAKLRAWRRMWARIMRDRFDCRNPRSLQYRIHVQTGGSSMTAQQPMNNIIRAALQVLASVLGGVQSMHTASYDEAIGLPSEVAVRTAIRTNQVILHETNIPAVTDPLGGSYYVEWLTARVEQEASKVLADIEGRGGFMRCIESGWLRSLLDRRCVQWRDEVDEGKRVVVGVNRFQLAGKEDIPPFASDTEEAERASISRVKRWKENRDADAVRVALEQVRNAFAGFDSMGKAGQLMPALMQAARNRCTLGEMMEALVEAGGGRAYSSQNKR